LDEIDRLLRLTLPLNIEESAVWPALELSSQAATAAHEFFAKLPLAPVLGIHPGSVWGTKRWQESGFAEVAGRAIAAGCSLIFFAGQDEQDVIGSILDKSGLNGHPQVYNMGARLSLPELAAWIARLDCYLTNDSGPMHMAWAQRVPVVAIFGPTTRSLGFFPRGGMSRVIEAQNVPCRPCGLHGPQVCPKKHHDCMRLIDPAYVWEQCANYLFLGKNLPV
jgi:heptosyltransferase-2